MIDSKVFKIGIEDGWNVLVGADKEKILKAMQEFEPAGETYSYRFGDGKASERIAEISIVSKEGGEI